MLETLKVKTNMTKFLIIRPVKTLKLEVFSFSSSLDPVYSGPLCHCFDTLALITNADALVRQTLAEAGIKKQHFLRN